MDKKITAWFTMNGKHIPIYEGESKEDAFNRSIVKDAEDKKQREIAKNKEQADKLNGKEPGKMINGKFYTVSELKKMSTEELRTLMQGQNKNDATTSKSSNYSFSSDKNLSDTEKGWLEQSVDWAKGEDNLPMVGMNTISSYYGVKFGKSASAIKEIKDSGDITFSKGDKALMNQAFDAVSKLKTAIRKKENLK